MITPTGVVATLAVTPGSSLQVAGEYILARLRDVAFLEEGNSRFQISLAGQRPATIDISVRTFGGPPTGVL
jgi:hypothetical protein